MAARTSGSPCGGGIPPRQLAFALAVRSRGCALAALGTTRLVDALRLEDGVGLVLEAHLTPRGLLRPLLHRGHVLASTQDLKETPYARHLLLHRIVVTRKARRARLWKPRPAASGTLASGAPLPLHLRPVLARRTARARARLRRQGQSQCRR